MSALARCGRGLRAPAQRHEVQLSRPTVARPPARRVATMVAAPSASAPVDDKTVPEGHKGLHGFLYGEGGAEEHDVGSYEVRKGEDEGAVVMPVPAYLDTRDGEKPLGVYCVYDANMAPQYIGYSRNMVLAIKGHLARVGPSACAHVRAMVYGNRAMSSRANLERGLATWVDELLGGAVPPANADPELRAAWEGSASAPPSVSASTDEAGGGGLAAASQLDTRYMSPAELAAYEEKKLKMRKAMGEKMVEGRDAQPANGHDHGHGGEDGDDDDLETRRRKLMAAMNRGDWSAVISAQTAEALGDGAADGAAADGAAASPSASPASAPAAAAASLSSTDGIVSPFASMDVQLASSGAKRKAPERDPLTPAAVQLALEEVRPYLLADGGDVEVVEVDKGVVFLRLQGACSTCSSQTATMKGGIERVIRDTFGDQVRDILLLDHVDPGATVARVDASLDMLRGAIHNYGGRVEVVAVEDGVCTLRYTGPPAIGKGVQGAVKDQFKDLREVRLIQE